MIDAAPTPPLRPRRPSPVLAALLGWIVPGLGHAYVGRPKKGLFLFAVILSTYGAGLVLAEFRCVSWERDPFWFAAQSVAAGPTALVAWLARDLPMDRRIPTFDVGLLYVSVASLLNAVAVADALGLVDDRWAAAAENEAEEARREAAIRAAALAGATAFDDPAATAGPDVVPPPLPPALPPHLGTTLGSAAADAPPTDAPKPPPRSPLLPRADLPDYGGAP
jgi:hypothetical protein